VVKARLGRKATSAKKVGTVVAVPLALIVGGVAMKMACGACCGDDHDRENHGGGAGTGSGGGNGGGLYQAPVDYGGGGGGTADATIATNVAAMHAAEAPTAFASRQADAAKHW
jgi:hypothetical protein